MEMLMGVLLALLAAWASSIEARFRSLNKKISDSVSKDDVIEFIDMKLEGVKLLQSEVMKRLDKIDEKLDNISSKQ